MSNETKFTPGPWRIISTISSCSVYAGKRCVLEYCFGPDEQNRANAHLIAAAPDLYQIVDRLLNYKESENEGVSLIDNDRFFDDAMSALAKSRGEE